MHPWSLLASDPSLIPRAPVATTSRTTHSSSSRSARSTPVLVIRPPVQPPLTQSDWEPPSAFGVHSPEGFKSEQSISRLRPYTPSPSVSTFAPSSATSSSVTTPRADLPPAHPAVPHVLQKATEALALHAQQSSDSISSESHYSDPGVAPESVLSDEAATAQEAYESAESIETAEPVQSIPEPEPAEAQSVDLHDEIALSSPAVESLQVERPLSPVAVELASSSSTSTSHRQPIIRSSLLGFFSRWADKRPPSLKERSDSPPPRIETPPTSHDINRSTDRLGSFEPTEEVRPSSSSFKSSVFRKTSFHGLRLNSGSLRRAPRTDSGPVPPLPISNPSIQVSPPPSAVPATRTVLVADVDFPPETNSVRSGKRRRVVESQSSVGTFRSKAQPQSRPVSEEPIGGEPVLISSQLLSESAVSESIQFLAAPETASRDLPTPPRSRSPSIFRQKLGGKRYRTGSLRDLVKRPAPIKPPKAERAPPAFLSWITSHAHRSRQNEPDLPILPTPTATPDPSIPPAETPPPPIADPATRESSRILSLVWYPPELIKSPYASNVSLDQIRAPHPTPAPLEQYERALPARPVEPERTNTNTPQPIFQPQPQPPLSYHQSFFTQDPYPRDERLTSPSSSTIHAPTTTGRRTPAKLRRRRRPGSKHTSPRTPPTSYSPILSRKGSHVRGESAESVAGSSAPSQSLDTLLNSAWPEPPAEHQVYNYQSETGAEDDSDQEEYLASPTSIGGTSFRSPTSPFVPAQEQRILPPVIHTVLDGDPSDWQPDSRVTSYLTSSPTIRSPASARIRHPKTQPRQAPASTSPILAAFPPPPPVPKVTSVPVVRPPSPPRRSTSYHSTISQVQAPAQRSEAEERRSTVTPNSGSSRRRLSNQSRKDPYPTSRRESNLSKRDSGSRRDSKDSNQPRKESNQPLRDSNQPLRDSNQPRRDSSQPRRDSNQPLRDSNQPRRDSKSSHKDASAPVPASTATETQIWAVPRNHRSRPTISFEFPPTSEFWQFLGEYQKFSKSRKEGSGDSGYGQSGNENDMSRRSGSSGGSTSKADPVKDWYRTQPSPSQATPERMPSPVVPTPDMVQRNELIVNALKNAPGALHTRFRHFGQLGVLGWSSEFSELVDEIQRCGLERQMFTTTREQALATCRELLRLHIDVSMQMISMFLCSQIARLRRFLDGETEYTDYPTPDFPLPQMGY